MQYYEEFWFLNLGRIESQAIEAEHSAILLGEICPNDFVQLCLSAGVLNKPLYSIRRHPVELNAAVFKQYL